MQFKKSLLMLAPTLLLASCLGGGSGSSNSDGSSVGKISSQFIDDPVVGLNYAGTFGSKGVTGKNGSFSCFPGEIVIFKLGTNIDLGEAVCGDMVFLQNLSSKDHASKVGALLQSFGIEDGQITIPESVRKQTLPSVSISSLNDSSIANFFSDPALSDLSITPISIADATANIQVSLGSYLQLPTELVSAVDTLTDARMSAYNSNMDPHNPTYSLLDTTIIPTHTCAGLDVDSLEFKLGFYKSGGLFYAEMYTPAEYDADEDETYPHKTLGNSLISGQTFGIGGSSICMDENNSPIACSYTLTGKIDIVQKKIVGTFSINIPSDNINCRARVNQSLNF